MGSQIYRFGKGINDTGMFDAEIVGGKGAKLAEMGSIGVPVPSGVTITTDECMSYINAASSLYQQSMIMELVKGTLKEYEAIKDDLGYMPLVSVRSGSRVSMPGMMDTVLNVGINNSNLDEWSACLGKDTAIDCYIRLIKMYSEVVFDIPLEKFDTLLQSATSILEHHLAVFKDETGLEFPQTIEEQLAGSIEAVFMSWNSERAVAYRAIHGYPDDWGTAVNIQQMVFGNRNNNSCSGVLFTRNFNTGENYPVIDWVPNAQGEDVVSGAVTPNTLDELIEWNAVVFTELQAVAVKLEMHYNDMQDIEFTVDNGELFILQTRDGKRSAAAAFRIAYDLCTLDKTLTKKEAVARVTGKQYLALTGEHIDPEFDIEPHMKGIGASGSVVSGVAVFSAAAAIACKQPCILVTKETTPKDFSGMAASVGILTQTGGVTSHAAVVARGMNKTCVVGAEKLKIGGSAEVLPEFHVQEGERVTIDGSTGNIWLEIKVPVIRGEIAEYVAEMIGWATNGQDALFRVTPTMAKEETGQVYVDVSNDLHTQTKLIAAMKSVKGSKSHGVIGFGLTGLAEQADSEFFTYFGTPGRIHDRKTMEVIVKTLKKPLWTKTMKQAWALHLPAGTSIETMAEIGALGWKVVTLLRSFKGALASDGYVELDPAFEDKLDEEEMTFGELTEFINRAGGLVQELPTFITRNRMMFDVLG